MYSNTPFPCDQNTEQAILAGFDETQIVKAPTILLVDDDKDQLCLLEFLLSSKGYKTICSESAVEALAKLQMSSFDLLICDIMMPEIDGIELVKHLRRKKNFSDLPIIMLTAARSELEFTSLALGADCFCQKRHVGKTLIPQVELLLG